MPTMKEDVATRLREKLERLAALDRTRQVGGASRHRYRLGDPAAPGDITLATKRLGVVLPDQVVQFYVRVGNGGAGPYFGLRPLAKIESLRCGDPYPGLETFHRIAEEEGEPLDEEGYFEVPRETICGLLAIADIGCGHELCVVATPGESELDAGQVVTVSLDGCIAEHGRGFLEEYEGWLDHNLNSFEEIERLIRSDLSMEEIYQHMVDHFRRYDGRDLVVSRLGIPKPVELFGDDETGRRYHGASQFPWYQKQLDDHRAGKLRPEPDGEQEIAGQRRPWWRFWG